MSPELVARGRAGKLLRNGLVRGVLGKRAAVGAALVCLFAAVGTRKGLYHVPARPGEDADDEPSLHTFDPSARLAAWLPETPVAVFYVPDVEEVARRLPRTGLARLAGEAEAGKFLEHLYGCLPPAAASAAALAGSAVRALERAVSGGLLIAVVEAPPGRGPEVLLAAEVADEPQKVRSLASALGALAMVFGKAVHTRGEEGVLIASTSSELIRSPRAGPGPPGKAARECGRGHVFSWLDVTRLEPALGVRLPPWLRGPEAVAVATRIGRSIRETVYLEVPHAEGGLFKNLSGPEIDLLTSRWLPASTMAAVFIPMEAEGPRSWARGLADPLAEKVVPARWRSTMTSIGRVCRGEAALGLFNAGRVGWFPTLALVSEAEGAGGGPSGPLAGEIGDLLEGAWKKVRRYPADGGTVFYPDAVLRRSRNPFAAPAVAAAEGFVFAGTDALSLKMMLDLRGEDSLSEQAPFGELLRLLPGRRSALFYLDTKRLVSRGFEPYGPIVLEALLLGARQGPFRVPAASINRALLPGAEVLASGLGPSGAAVLSEEGGLLVEVITPAGCLLTGGAIWLVARSLADALETGTRKGLSRVPTGTSPRRHKGTEGERGGRSSR